MSYIGAERAKDKVKVWERVDGKRLLKLYPAPFYFYVEDERGEHTSLFGDKCSRLDFDSYDEFSYAKRQFENSRTKMFESDISSEFKVLANHYYNKPAPKLNVSFLDIEVDYNKEIGFSSVDNPYAPVSAVAFYNDWSDETILLAVPPKGWGDAGTWESQLDQSLRDLAEIKLFSTEKELLKELLRIIEPADAICGWNSDFFDVPYIAKRLELVLGKAFMNRLSFDGAKPPRFRDVEVFGRVQQTCDLGGRLSIDYLQLFKKFEMSNRPSYKLESISNDVLPHLPKLEYDGTLADLYNDDFNYFLRYNIRDTECLKGFEEKMGYVALANEFYHLSTGLFSNVYGTIKLAELALVNYCHEELGVIAPNVPKVKGLDGKAQGAFVLQPKAGFQEWIGSIDITSLYPSAIRAINISPETLIGQFSRNVTDFESIVAQSDVMLTLVLENGESSTQKAIDWKGWLLKKGYSVSGYGTVFDQAKAGIIPEILTSWFDTRVEYRDLASKYKSEGDHIKAAYYDRLQYCYKIKLNSLYGALLNRHFRFYDPRMGESTTGTGRAILKFMCSRANELLTGEFDPDGEAVIYGDTDSCYFATFADNAKDATVIADHVAGKVNESFPSFMENTFLCGEEYKGIIEAGREVVASAGIFVTPKRYMLRVVDNEGEICDKLKVMGLDTKKTTLPKVFQDKLNGWLERYLKGEDWDIIAEEIVQFKEEIFETDDITFLGLPKGVNGVEEYTKLLAAEGDAARLPGHVRASIYYNQMLDAYDDKESFKIQSSMKIRVFYLKSPIGKYKSIALPTDLNTVPQWFLDNIDVDRSKQILRLVDNPLENILKAVNKVPPTRQTMLVDDLLSF